jgi:hypothetical protein
MIELPPPPPYRDEGLDDFRDFVNFIDGVGLSAQWTPEYDFDWIRVGDHQPEPRRPSREPQPSQSPGPEDIGTPFSTWLPSAPADDQVHLRSHAEDSKFFSHCLTTPMLINDSRPWHRKDQKRDLQCHRRPSQLPSLSSLSLSPSNLPF